MANILIIQAHPEPESFSSALAKTYRDRLLEEGHEVVFRDLYALGFDPVSGRGNFQQEHDPNYFKQQAEESFASDTDGFSELVEGHIRDLERCDALVFSFPLWWFSMPAILKGWVDRVFPMGRIYGGTKLYEGGVGQARKPATILMTTGGPAEQYNGWSVNPSMEWLLSAIEHGVFWFNGFKPLPARVAYGPARWSQEERVEFLRQTSDEAALLFERTPRELPRLAEFEGGKVDTFVRSRVEIRLAREQDDAYRALRPTEHAYVDGLKRAGKVTEFRLSLAPEWVAYLDFRTKTEDEVERLLQGLPLASYFHWTIRKLEAPTR